MVLRNSDRYPSYTQSVTADDSGTTLEAVFHATPNLPAVMVYARHKMVGVLSYRMFRDTLSRAFGRELFLKRPIAVMIETILQPIFELDDQVELATACRLALSRDTSVRYEPILVTSLTSPPRIVALTTLLSAQADALEQALISQYELATELELSRSQAEHDATHDSLTGLLNRKGFLQQMQAFMASGSDQHGVSYSLLFLDLDRFKHINDSLGHQTGNELLIQVSERLTLTAQQCDANSCTAVSSVVGRHSGDEFVILQAASDDTFPILDAARQFYRELTLPYILKGQPYDIGVSIGVVSSLESYNSYEAALRDADIAMYEAKRSVLRKIVFFETSMYSQVEQRLVLETDLRQAILRGELTLYYEPIISTKTGSIFAHEALLRWNSPHGLLTPEQFIYLAEETGLINEIGFFVLESACNWLSDSAHLDRNRNRFVSINVSPVQLANSVLPTKFAEICKQAGVSPKRIIIEITEQCAMASPERTGYVLAELKDLGFMIALDDFGTGYSSLAWLHKLPVDIIKIDKSLINEVDSSESTAKMAAGILNMCASLDLKVVAEGVERSTQAHKLQRLGFHLLQGYYFGYPCPEPIMELGCLITVIDEPVEHINKRTAKPVLNPIN